jgi:hypothetical protein
LLGGLLAPVVQAQSGPPRDLTVERDVFGQIDVAHPARADLVQDLIVGDRLADQFAGDFRSASWKPTLYTQPRDLSEEMQEYQDRTHESPFVFTRDR